MTPADWILCFCAFIGSAFLWSLIRDAIRSRLAKRKGYKDGGLVKPRPDVRNWTGDVTFTNCTIAQHGLTAREEYMAAQLELSRRRTGAMLQAAGEPIFPAVWDAVQNAPTSYTIQ